MSQPSQNRQTQQQRQQRPRHLSNPRYTSFQDLGLSSPRFDEAEAEVEVEKDNLNPNNDKKEEKEQGGKAVDEREKVSVKGRETGKEEDTTKGRERSGSMRLMVEWIMGTGRSAGPP